MGHFGQFSKMSKYPGRGQNDQLPLQCDSGKSREFIDKNSSTFSETIPQQHFLDLELKIIKVSELKCLIKNDEVSVS